MPVALALLVTLAVPGATDDPWTAEAASDPDEGPREKASGPIEFIDSPFAAAALVFVSSGLVAVGYAGIATWGAGQLALLAPQFQLVATLSIFSVGPLFVGASAVVASILLRPWWEAALAGLAGLAGGGVGLLIGLGLFVGLAPVAGNLPLLLFGAGLAVPLALAVIAATVTAGLVPLAEDQIRAFTRRPPPQLE